jgi:hypothetical protein
MSIDNQTKEIQKLFSEIATESGFQKTKKAWFYSKRIADDHFLFLELVKPRWGGGYQPWIKIFVSGVFDRHYSNLTEVPLQMPTAWRVEQASEFSDLFDSEAPLESEARREGIHRYFKEIVSPVIIALKENNGIQKLLEMGLVGITPPIKSELERLKLWKIE